jgi:hypothetical protein
MSLRQGYRRWSYNSRDAEISFSVEELDGDYIHMELGGP